MLLPLFDLTNLTQHSRHPTNRFSPPPYDKPEQRKDHVLNQLKEQNSYNQSRYYGFYHALIPALHNASGIKVTKPVAYPMCNANYYDGDYEVFPNNFPGWFTLGFCDNVAQYGKNRQTPYQTNNNGSR